MLGDTASTPNGVTPGVGEARGEGATGGWCWLMAEAAWGLLAAAEAAATAAAWAWAAPYRWLSPSLSRWLSPSLSSAAVNKKGRYKIRNWKFPIKKIQIVINGALSILATLINHKAWQGGYQFACCVFETLERKPLQLKGIFPRLCSFGKTP